MSAVFAQAKPGAPRMTIAHAELEQALGVLHAKYFTGDEGRFDDPNRARRFDELRDNTPPGTPNPALHRAAMAHALALRATRASWTPAEANDYHDALCALGRAGDAEFIAATVQSLAVPDPDSLAQACVVLRHAAPFLADTQAVPTLVALLESGNALILPDVIAALGSSRDTRAVRALHAQWLRGGHLEATARALAELGYADSLPLLALGLGHPQVRVRLYAALAMAHIASQHDSAELANDWGSLIPRLELALSDLFPPVRVMVACCLAQLGRRFSNHELRLLLECSAQHRSALQAFMTRAPR